MESQSADQYLVEQIRAGQDAAWRELIDRFHGRLMAFVRQRTPSLTDAEDIVQETFVGFLQSLPNYDAARPLETYLFTIARFKLIDRLRTRRLTPLESSDEDEDAWDRIAADGGETPSRLAVAAEDAALREQVLDDVLRRLICDYRDRGAFEDLQIIELLFYGGRRNLEVAELFDKDQKAIAGVKFRAIGKLRKFLEEMPSSCELTDEHAEITVSRVWRERRLTCLKRSTLGSYLLGVLDEPWLSYTQFHLDVVGCPMCLANLRDLEEEEEGGGLPERVYASSVGFLSRASAG